MEETQAANQIGRDAIAEWQTDLQSNVYHDDKDFIHTIAYHFPDNFALINAELEQFGRIVASTLEPLVAENHLAKNLPSLKPYDGIGDHIDEVIHHPSYIQIGDIIYSTKLMEKMYKPGGLTEALSLFFLSSQVGEAGHNCPIACSAGMMRVLNKIPDFPDRKFYLDKLMAPSFQSNFTGAQFLTEIQGGCDVGQNATYAKQEKDNIWRITGEKWFCSNANADLIFITARYNPKISGTKGLGLFLIPALWKNARNFYTLRRLKDKFGTRTMATAEIDFHGAFAIAMGEPHDGFKLVMENVLHISRLFNTFSELAMARRAYAIASSYAQHRVAFSHPIIQFPLVKENLARIKAENAAMLAAAYMTAHLQDQLDQGNSQETHLQLLLRLLVNLQKYLSARWSVEHIHHALDVLAGNGTIETFSPLPRFLSDSIVCENWEGTHNILRMQILKDIHKYKIDQIYFAHMHKELKRIAGQSVFAQLITDELLKLERDMVNFLELDEDLQALQIRLIVDRMVILYCALCLLFEALDQIKTKKSTSKLDCMHYFCSLHLFTEKTELNREYLDLISRIVKVDM
ncbi:MAG: acyl-CoA dehydrogenase family protein [Gammaproteobacteria bacterium]